MWQQINIFSERKGFLQTWPTFNPCHGKLPLRKYMNIWPSASKSSLLLCSAKQHRQVNALPCYSPYNKNHCQNNDRNNNIRYVMLRYVTFHCYVILLCCVVLCCVVLCCIVLWYDVCYDMLCYVMLCYVMLCYVGFMGSYCHAKFLHPN